MIKLDRDGVDELVLYDVDELATDAVVIFACSYHLC